MKSTIKTTANIILSSLDCYFGKFLNMLRQTDHMWGGRLLVMVPLFPCASKPPTTHFTDRFFVDMVADVWYWEILEEELINHDLNLEGENIRRALIPPKSGHTLLGVPADRADEDEDIGEESFLDLWRSSSSIIAVNNLEDPTARVRPKWPCPELKYRLFTRWDRPMTGRSSGVCGLQHVCTRNSS